MSPSLLAIGSLVAAVALLYYSLLWMGVCEINQRYPGYSGMILLNFPHTWYTPLTALLWFLWLGFQ